MAANQAGDIGILKSMWRKNEAGKWVIHDAKGINLKPREGFSADYFKIKSELVLLTERPGAVFENIFSSFGMTEFLLRQSIVPIVSWNEGDDEIRCIGTGFFVSATGYLLTAAHVVRDPIDEKYASLTEVNEKQHKLSETLNFGVLLPNNPAIRTAPFITLDQSIRETPWFMCPFE
jgi:S1-C subfamily serine protease